MDDRARSTQHTHTARSPRSAVLQLVVTRATCRYTPHKVTNRRQVVVACLAYRYSQVYGSSYEGEERHVESDVLEPTNPYAATKAAAENIVMSYWHSFKLPVRACL